MLAISLATTTLALAAAAAAQTEASAATSTDPTLECKPYGLAAITELAKSYPTIWSHATIPASDTEAQALFNALNGSIPNIAPKGSPDATGNFSDEAHYPTSDPDCWWTDTKCTKPKIPGIPDDVTQCPTDETWGLTYDDGPNCSHNALYDYLQANKQKATLFYIASNVLDWPLEAQRGLADGHEICAHTWSHPYMTSLNNEQVFAELYYSKKAIKDVIGITVQCWRPPFGDVDDRVRYIAGALGMQTVIWAQDTFDWNYAAVGISGVEKNYETIIAMGSNGTFNNNNSPIVLSHELDNTTMSLAVEFYPKIAEAYKYVAPVAVCRSDQTPYVEKDVIYPNFAEWTSGSRTISLVSPTISDAAVADLPLSTGNKGSLFPNLAYASSTAPQPTGGGSGGVSGASSSAGANDASATHTTESSAGMRRASVGWAGRGEVVGIAATAVAVMAGWSWLASLV